MFGELDNFYVHIYYSSLKTYYAEILLMSICAIKQNALGLGVA